MADHESIRKLAAAVVNDMTETGKAVSTAESCTGGWVAKALTDIPGSSAVFHYGVVSYSNGAKEHILGVQNATLEEHGSVSQPVVEEMAEGVLNLSGSDMAVAVSGIAGPDGASPNVTGARRASRSSSARKSCKPESTFSPSSSAFSTSSRAIGGSRPPSGARPITR